MHERTERAFCRLAFLLLCALPTLVTFIIAVLTLTPWYHQHQISRLESALTQRLGVTVSISDMRRPSPGEWQIEGIELRDPETGTLVASVRIANYENNDGQIGLHLSQPEIQATELPLAWRVIHDRFLCQPELLGERLRLRAQDLSLISRPHGLTLSTVDVWVDPRADETEAIAHFSLAGSDTAGKPAELRILRDRNGTHPQTVWKLQTGSRPLPCSVLADYLPVMRHLGLDAEFSGMLCWWLEREDYSVELKGARFDRVNMLELFEPFDFHVSGMGSIEIQSLTRHSGEPISEAIGKLTINGGRIETGLVKQLGQLFGSSANLPYSDDSQRIPFQMLATEFKLFGNDVEVAGICRRQTNFESAETGTALIADDRPVLYFDPRQRIASRQLTSVLDPSGKTRSAIGTRPDWARQLLPNVSSTLAEQADSPTGPSVGRLRLNR